MMPTITRMIDGLRVMITEDANGLHGKGVTGHVVTVETGAIVVQPPGWAVIVAPTNLEDCSGIRMLYCPASSSQNGVLQTFEHLVGAADVEEVKGHLQKLAKSVAERTAA